MSAPLTLDLLDAATSPGGSSCLAFSTELAPAGGWHTSVAPAKYTTPGRNSTATYAYEVRFADGVERDAVVIDSKQSTNNRLEAEVASAIYRGEDPLARLPRIEVTYSNGEVFSDLVLPHRFTDGHIRAGSIDGEPTTQTEVYRALRNATPLDASALLNRSPFSLLLGAWDSSRRSRQGRWRSLLTGEVMGFLPGPAQTQPRSTGRRGGARVDPVGMQVQLSAPTVHELIAEQSSELSQNLIDKLTQEAAAAAKSKGGKPVSGSRLGLGGIPPALEALGGVACDRITRTRVLSFAALRQIRFGGDTPGDVACRSLLAALALAGIARADAELDLRANCTLIEASPTVATLDQRGGRTLDVVAPTIAEADELLRQALSRAERDAGVVWDGSVLAVVGNPNVVRGAVDDEGAAE